MTHQRRVHREGGIRPVYGQPDVEIIPVCGQVGRVQLTTDPNRVTCVRCTELAHVIGPRRVELAESRGSNEAT